MKKTTGWDGLLTPDSSENIEEVYCMICGDKCNVKRKCNGPRSWVEAMGKFKSEYDEFLCPNVENKWHKQSTLLLKKAESTPSKKLEIMFIEEAKEIIKNKKETKKVSGCYEF